jgi:hypothetical protein
MSIELNLGTASSNRLKIAAQSSASPSSLRAPHKFAQKLDRAIKNIALQAQFCGSVLQSNAFIENKTRSKDGFFSDLQEHICYKTNIFT